MTAAGLLKRLLVGRMRDRYDNPELIDLTMQRVLDGVAELMASSDEPGWYRPDPLCDGSSSIVERVARKMRWFGNREVIANSIDTLTRLQFVLIYADGSMRLAIPDRKARVTSVDPAELLAGKLTSKEISGKYNGLYSPGAPRGREMKESYEERKALKRGAIDREIAEHVGPQLPGETTDDHRLRVLRHFEGKRPQASPEQPMHQGSLPLPLSGSLKADQQRISVPLADKLRSQMQVLGSTLTQPATQTAAHWVPTSVSLSASLVPTQAAAAALESMNPIDLAAAAASLLSRDASAPGSQNPNLEPKTQTNPEPKPEPKLGPTASDAERLAALARTKAVLEADAPSESREIMQGYIDGGASVAEIEWAIINVPPRTSIKSAAYYGPRLPRARHELQVSSKAISDRAAAAQPPTPPRPPHPNLESNPAWMKLTEVERYKIGVFLAAMDEADPVKRKRTIEIMRRQGEQEFEKVARRYPELRAMADYDPLRRSA